MNSERILEAFSKIGDDHDSIQQLRKIAIALAVSGKLDRGAATLSPRQVLGAVDRVKADLVKQGIIPKPKKHAEVTLEQLPEAFSDVTRFAPLGELAKIEKGQTGIQKAQPGAFPLVVTAAERATCDHFDFIGSAAIIPLVSSTGHGNASINRLHYQEGKFALGTILVAVFPHDPKLISARFLFEYLSAFKEELLVSRMTGTANVTLSVGRVADVPIPLICPEVQRKVDELMALCDQLEQARAGREAVRDRLTTASLARLTAPEIDAAVLPAEVGTGSASGNATTKTAFQSHARFALQSLHILTTRPDQIKPLRQTILNLAVRGKLVTQDAADEPAAELLKVLQAKKNRLVKDGAIRKQKVSAALSESEEIFPLPLSWKWTRLLDVGATQTGTSPSSARDELFGDFIPFVKPADLDGPEITYDGFGLSEEGVGHSRVAPANSVMMVCIGGTLGKVNCTSRDVCFNQQINSVTPFIGGLHRYISMALKSSYFQDLAWAKAGIGTLPIISKGKWEVLPIPLPPLAEQHRIVAKVDALMALCDQLEASLTTTATTRSKLLNAVLHEALEPTTEERVAAE
jgi:type I restriction enzyme S subunit